MSEGHPSRECPYPAPESGTSGIIDSQPLTRHLGNNFTAGLLQARKVPGCVCVCVLAHTCVNACSELSENRKGDGIADIYGYLEPGQAE